MVTSSPRAMRRLAREHLTGRGDEPAGRVPAHPRHRRHPHRADPPVVQPQLVGRRARPPPSTSRSATRGQRERRRAAGVSQCLARRPVAEARAHRHGGPRVARRATPSTRPPSDDHGWAPVSRPSDAGVGRRRLLGPADHEGAAATRAGDTAVAWRSVSSTISPGRDSAPSTSPASASAAAEVEPPRRRTPSVQLASPARRGRRGGARHRR